MKAAILAFGLCLAGAQGLSAQVCCLNKPTQKSSCGDCGESSKPATPAQPDCCTSLDAPKDIDVATPEYTLPVAPIVIDLVPVDPAFAPSHPVVAALVAQLSDSRAGGPPLYLRNRVLLI